jgi:hypothetical protein
MDMLYKGFQNQFEKSKIIENVYSRNICVIAKHYLPVHMQIMKYKMVAIQLLRTNTLQVQIPDHL